MTLAHPSRRRLLKNLIGSRTSLLAPPWAVSEFTRLCTRCDACIDACEESILKRGDGGFPEVDFSNSGCSFCADCVSVCKARALIFSSRPPWLLKAEINGQCLSANGVICRSCGDVCEQRAIYFRIQTGGRAVAEISAESCNGCGYCYALCPQKAIEMKEMT